MAFLRLITVDHGVVCWKEKYQMENRAQGLIFSLRRLIFPPPLPTGVSQWTACVEIRTDTPQRPPPPKYISCEIRKLRNVSELKMLALLMEAWKG